VSLYLFLQLLRRHGGTVLFKSKAEQLFYWQALQQRHMNDKNWVSGSSCGTAIPLLKTTGCLGMFNHDWMDMYEWTNQEFLGLKYAVGICLPVVNLQTCLFFQIMACTTVLG